MKLTTNIHHASGNNWIGFQVWGQSQGQGIGNPLTAFRLRSCSTPVSVSVRVQNTNVWMLYGGGLHFRGVALNLTCFNSVPIFSLSFL